MAINTAKLAVTLTVGLIGLLSPDTGVISPPVSGVHDRIADSNPDQGFSELQPNFASDESLPIHPALVHVFQLEPWERVNSVSISEDGALLAAGTALGVRIFDLESLTERDFIPTSGWVRSTALTADGTLLAAGLFDHTIRFWSTENSRPGLVLDGHQDWVRDLVFSPDETLLASTSDDGTVRIWDLASGSSLQVFRTPDLGIRVLAFSHDGANLAVGTRSGDIQIWRVRDGKLVGTLTGHSAWIRSLSYSEDGTRLISGAFDATARIWDMTNLEQVSVLEGHSSSVLGVGFSGDNQLAVTGSVDHSIRIWDPEDGVQEAVLSGHTGFIYDLDLSSRGDILVSGSDDASIRIWDLTKIDQVDFSASVHDASSDCRACHHPPSSSQPPAVIEVRCEVCHPGGAALNWCPFFPARKESPTTDYGSVISAEQSVGVPEPGEDLMIEISSPSNGEAVYTTWLNTAPLFVTGLVHTNTELDLEQVEFFLEVRSDNQENIILPFQPGSDGYYSVSVGINPTGTDPVASTTQIDAGRIVCDDCHGEFEPEAFLPSGEIELVVRAVSGGVEIAHDRRWIQVDVSSQGTIPVEIIDQETGQPLEGLLVDAVTRFYEWRGRNFSASSDINGTAEMPVEMLTQASTSYRITVPEQNLSGTVYRGLESVEVILPPDDDIRDSIQISVQMKRGRLSGFITGSKEDLGTVYAILEPAGPVYSAPLEDGRFVFDDLPVGSYRVIPVLDSPPAGGMMGRMQRVDLAENSEYTREVQLTAPDGEFIGRVLGSRDEWIPFVWLEAPDAEQVRSNINTGLWSFPAGEQSIELELTAPGYYSLTTDLDSGSMLVDQKTIQLEKKPGTRLLEYGSGQIWLPEETDAAVDEGVISVHQGWIWGQGEPEYPVLISASGYEIVWESGRFAITLQPGLSDWFYLFDGGADIRFKDAEKPISIQPGSMTALEKDGKLLVLEYHPAVYQAVSIDSEKPFAEVQPSRLELVLDRITWISLGTAKSVTVISYAVSLTFILFVIGIPIRKVILKKYHSNKNGKKE